MYERQRGREYPWWKFLLLNGLLGMAAVRWYGIHMSVNLHFGSLYLSTEGSTIVFGVFLMVYYMICLQVTTERSRTGFQTAANILLPLEIYTVISYFDIWPVFVRGTLAGTAAAVLLFLTLYLRARRQMRRGRRDRRGFWNAWLSMRVVAALSMSVLLIAPLLGYISRPEPYAAASARSAGVPDAQEWNREEQKEVLLTLQDEEWEGLSGEERLQTLQTVANIECVELGIPCLVSVRAASLEENVAGEYSYMEHQIRIDKDLLERGTAYDALEVILHECRHAWQRACVEAYQSCGENFRNLSLFRDAAVWAEEFENYIVPEEEDVSSILAYEEQSTERDSRNYAEKAGKYMDYVQKCLRNE